MRVQISGGLYASVMAVLSLTMQYLLLIRPIIQFAGQEAWIAVITGGLYGLILVLAVVWLACRFPDRDPLGGITRILGPWAAFPVRLLLTLTNVQWGAVAVRGTEFFVTVLLLPETPEWVLGIIIVAVAVFAALHGIEPVARLVFATLLPSAAVLVLLPAGLYREIRLLHVDPFFYHGFDGLLRAMAVTMCWGGQAVFAMTLIPHLSPKSNPYRWTCVGIGVGTLLFAEVAALVTLSFGTVLPGRMIYPGYDLLAIVDFPEGVERVQAIILVLWLASTMSKVAINLSVALEEGSFLVGHHRRTGLAIILGAAVLLLGRLVPGSLALASLRTNPIWITAVLASQLLVVLLLGALVLAARLKHGGSLRG